MNHDVFTIEGKDQDGIRIESRLLEEHIQQAVEAGMRNLSVNAYGQHGIGGRLWKAGDEKVYVRVDGAPGQRLGCFGFPNTVVEVFGPASDDTGWLNGGAEIIVHGHATNGTCNAMAQGKVMIAGSIGSRGMTMTKNNPRFAPPELWVLGSTGDYFGEFMAGGVAVVCGHDAVTPENVLGYRPLVGMVGGKVFFRGPIKGYSQGDAKPLPIDDAEWKWLTDGLKDYLLKVKKPELYDRLAVREDWQLVVARTPQEKVAKPRRSMTDFHRNVWDAELGKGGMIGDLSDLDMSPIPLIATGDMRRFVPVWENRKYKAPCEGTCPTGIPVQQRWQLIREGRIDEAVDMALAYTPFPASVCGYLCPNPCMSACTRRGDLMVPIDVKQLGKASIQAGIPAMAALSGRKIAVIGGGPAGLSVAWQLRQKGHEATVFDLNETLGGKIASVIPESRIPKEVLDTEIARIREVLPHIHLQQALTKEDVTRLKGDYDFIVVATGAAKPRMLPVAGKELQVTSLDFLEKSKKDAISPGRHVVVIGGGNVGCDVATEAKRLGAETVTIIDIQEPAAFGVERDEAEAAGAIFRWPCFTRELTREGVVLADGEILPADTIVTAIGDVPDFSFLPETVVVDDDTLRVNEFFQTTDSQIFAIGDILGLGLITDAIGAGRTAADAICDMAEGKRPEVDAREIIKLERVTLEYFDPRMQEIEGLESCGAECASCGNCRDCQICVSVCPRNAISRVEVEGSFEYLVDPEQCIGCGFCADACPCGIWDLVPNTPIG